MVLALIEVKILQEKIILFTCLKERPKEATFGQDKKIILTKNCNEKQDWLQKKASQNETLLYFFLL